jgi:2-dehydropantoate 2-reductase
MIPGLEARLQHIADLFNESGLETTLINNPESLMWGKLAINAAINPLTALLEVPNGVLVEHETLRQIMAGAASEVAEVAAAQGIDLPFTDAAGQAAKVSQATAGNRSSMLQDVSRAAPTEIDAISGAVVRLGKYFGIPTPVNELLLGLIKDKEAGRLALKGDKLKGLVAQLNGVI